MTIEDHGDFAAQSVAGDDDDRPFNTAREAD